MRANKLLTNLRVRTNVCWMREVSHRLDKRVSLTDTRVVRATEGDLEPSGLWL